MAARSWKPRFSKRAIISPTYRVIGMDSRLIMAYESALDTVGLDHDVSAFHVGWVG